jgi:hypothetical protein
MIGGERSSSVMNASDNSLLDQSRRIFISGFGWWLLRLDRRWWFSTRVVAAVTTLRAPRRVLRAGDAPGPATPQ